MHKHKLGKTPQKNRSMMDTAKAALRHVLIFGTISMAGHMATASLAQSAGALGMGIYSPVDSMGFTYGT